MELKATDKRKGETFHGGALRNGVAKALSLAKPQLFRVLEIKKTSANFLIV